MNNNIILSIHPQYAELIENGAKIYDIRTRKANIAKGTRIWIYKTLPVATISSYAELDDILVLAPEIAWEKYSKDMCISQELFNEYVKCKKEIYLLKIKNVKKTKKRITLEELRKKIPPFYPPQFFKKLDENSDILKALLKLLK